MATAKPTAPVNSRIRLGYPVVILLVSEKANFNNGKIT
jgi:hypothetical protein